MSLLVFFSSVTKKRKKNYFSLKNVRKTIKSEVNPKIDIVYVLAMKNKSQNICQGVTLI